MIFNKLKNKYDFIFIYNKMSLNKLLNVSDPVLAEILQYTGEYTTENKFAQKIINNENKKLQEWLIKTGVRTKWENIPIDIYEDLWHLYNSCNGGYPSTEYKYNEVLKDIFFSKQHTIPMGKKLQKTIDSADEYIESIDVDIVDAYVKSKMDTSVLRPGDTIWICRTKKYRNDDVVMWDGSKVVFLDIEIDEYGACNQKFDISTFPSTTYFENTIDHNHYVWLCTNVKIKTTTQLGNIYKIVRDDNIVIYTANEDFSENYSDSPYKWFSYDYEDFIDSESVAELNEDDRESAEWSKDYEVTKVTNPRILFTLE